MSLCIWVDGYFDRELDLVSSLRFEEHLVDCERCRGVLEGHGVLRAALRNERLRFVRRPASRRPWVKGLVAAAVLFLTWWLWPSPAPEMVAVHTRALLSGRVSEVASSDQHTVKPWFQGKIDYSPPVLAVEGFPLLGGRLDTVEGKTVAVLVYGRRKHLIDVFVWPEGGGGRSYRFSSRGYQAVSWRRGEWRWWAISDLNAEELDGFCQGLRVGDP